MARANITRCLCPSLICEKFRSAGVPGMHRPAWHHPQASSLLRRESRAFRYTDTCRSQPPPAGHKFRMKPLRHHHRKRPCDFLFPHPAHGCPSRKIVPPSSASCLVTVFNIVDLPAPFGPISVRTFPGLTCSEIWLGRAFLPYPAATSSSFDSRLFFPLFHHTFLRYLSSFLRSIITIYRHQEYGCHRTDRKLRRSKHRPRKAVAKQRDNCPLPRKQPGISRSGFAVFIAVLHPDAGTAIPHKGDRSGKGRHAGRQQTRTAESAIREADGS